MLAARYTGRRLHDRAMFRDDLLLLEVRLRSEESLTSLEQSLLYLLAANAGRLLTRDEILDHL